MVDKVSKILARTELQDSSCVLLENLLRLPAAAVRMGAAPRSACNMLPTTPAAAAPTAGATAARMLRLLLLRAAPGRRGLLGCAAAAPPRLPACAGVPPPPPELERKGATGDFFLKKY